MARDHLSFLYPFLRFATSQEGGYNAKEEEKTIQPASQWVWQHKEAVRKPQEPLCCIRPVPDPQWRAYPWRFELSLRKYSASTINSTKSAYKNCTALHNMVFTEIEYKDLQDNIDSYIGKLKHASLELILVLYHGMYKYALKNNLCQSDYSLYVEIRIPDDDEKGVPFTEDELKILWHSDLPEAKIAAILCYSGWRIGEFKEIEIDRKNNLFKGGLKTEAGRNRIVPIHPGILPLLNSLPDRPVTDDQQYRNCLYEALKKLGIKKHTPHDCRHTFSWLCDKYKVDRLSKKLMLEHSLGKEGDVTDAVYGHRTTEELRTEIEKILCY